VHHIDHGSQTLSPDQFCNIFKQLAAIFASSGAEDRDILPAFTSAMVLDLINGFSFVVGFTSGLTAEYINFWLLFSFVAQLSASLTAADNGIAIHAMVTAASARFDLRLCSGVIIEHAPSSDISHSKYGDARWAATRF
jgi:hypothetical protein